MAKGLTPIIGLAVVVALAMVAVFGAMSLTNPAFAAVGAPADAELAERTFSPQEDANTVYVGAVIDVDITDDITGGLTNFTAVTSANAVPGSRAIAGDAKEKVGSVRIPVTGLVAGEVRLTVLVALESGNTQTIAKALTVSAPTPAMAVGEIDEQMIPAGGRETVDVKGLFVNGKGDTTVEAADAVQIVEADGTITDYAAVSEPNTLVITPAANESDATAGGKITAHVDTGVFASTVFTLMVPSGTPAGTAYFVTITAEDDHDPDGTGRLSPASNDPAISFFVVAGDTSSTGAAGGAFDSDSKTPGKVTRHEANFTIPNVTNTLVKDLVIEMEDYALPSSIANTSIALTTSVGLPSEVVDDEYDATDVATDNVPRGLGLGDARLVETEYSFFPDDVTVSGDKIYISLGDVTDDDDKGVYDVGGGVVGNDGLLTGSSRDLTVVLRQAAGIGNPTEFGTYFINLEFGANKADGEDTGTDYLEVAIPRDLGLSEDDGGLGDEITATGKGYKNGTTLLVFVDRAIPVMWDSDNNDSTPMVRVTPSSRDDYNEDVNADATRGNTPMLPGNEDVVTEYVFERVTYLQAPNGELDLGEDVLCPVNRIDSEDTGKCSFIVTHPTFNGGLNYVNAVDGRTGYAGGNGPGKPAELDKLAVFDLQASISASPPGGSPGEIVIVQVVDFPRGPISKIEVAREAYCPTTDFPTCPGVADNTGAGNFQIEIPNWVKAGAQELRVTSSDPDVKGSTNVTFVGPQINVTPQTVLANQRISLIGTGFSPGAVIANDDDPDEIVSPVVTIGGDPIIDSRINDGDPVKVDNGGNWSASVDLPLSEATTAEGDRTIRITDSRGRTGVVTVDVPAREVTVTPDTGRVGTLAVVRGTGFPSKNDEGSSFNIQIVYDASNGNTTTVSALPDASGRFETQLRIPTTAAIPSSNSVKVEFEDGNDVKVVTTVAHEVPEGIITLSETSGGPGSTITISGEGFKSFVPISLVKVGTLDVTPAPKPATDGNGMMSFTVTIPGLDVGIQTIEVNVGRTTASTGFTVTESGINPGDIKAVAPALEDLGDNFVNIWHFNNDLKTWSFYDAQDGSDLTHLITGETYLMQIKSTVEVILNGDTRNLTCVGANCWNQIVW